MNWTEQPDGSWRSEGLYARQYRVYRDGNGWRGDSPGKSSRFAKIEDAKLFCEHREDELKRG